MVCRSLQPTATNVVSAVSGGIPDGLVLAHQEHGDGGGDAAEGSGVGADINVVPCSRVGKSCLGRLDWDGREEGCEMYLANELRHG